jgi:transcription antitermination factor NusG
MISWYVIRSKPHNEDFLWRQLCVRDIESYYPRIHVQTVNPRARKFQPYFPGYLFVHVDLDIIGTSSFEWMPGALGLVSFDSTPAYVPDGLIRVITQRVDQLSGTGTRFQKGDRIFIQDGVFTGYEAIFDTYTSGADRVRVLLTLLSGRQIPVELLAGGISTNQH